MKHLQTQSPIQLNSGTDFAFKFKLEDLQISDKLIFQKLNSSYQLCYLLSFSLVVSSKA